MWATIRVFLFAGLLLLPIACTTGENTDVSPADSLAASTVPTIAPDSLGAATDTLTAQDTAALLDSLRQEVARMNATLERFAPRSEIQEATPEQDVSSDSLDALDQLRAQAQNVQSLGVQILLTFLLILAAFYFTKVIVWLLETFSERSATRRLFFKKLIPIARLLLYTLTAYIVIAGIFQVSGDKLLAASAALGVAIGFAAQDILKNMFGGVLIILDQPFQVGDKISVGGTYGEVVSIGLRSTRIVTLDDNLVSVPNAQVVDGQVANANAGALDCQVVIDLYLPGSVDVMQAKSIAFHAAASSKYVFLDKPIVVLIKDEFDYRFVTHVVVKAYVLDTRYESVFASDVTETAKMEYLRVGLLPTASDNASDYPTPDAPEVHP